MAKQVNPLILSQQDVSHIRRSATRLARRLRRERPVDGIPLAKLSVLANLYRHGEMSASRIAELDRVQPQSMTRLLAELTNDGLITRVRDAEDGRRQRIAITEAGAALLAADMAERDAWLAQALASDLSPEEQELLLRASELMERLANSDSD